MENIIQDIRDWFEDINKISSILKNVNCDDRFAPPASAEEITNWEKENNIVIPAMYKSWLMLTKYARILGGEYELYFPEISEFYKDSVAIGSLYGDGTGLLFSVKTGEIYQIDDEGERVEYENFADFLAYIYLMLEDEARNEYGETWLQIYDENFGEE